MLSGPAHLRRGTGVVRLKQGHLAVHAGGNDRLLADQFRRHRDVFGREKAGTRTGIREQSKFSAGYENHRQNNRIGFLEGEKTTSVKLVVNIRLDIFVSTNICTQIGLTAFSQELLVI